MLIDSSKEMSEDFLRVDLCIVGSGPAGITLARQICRFGFRVCLPRIHRITH